MAFVLYGTPARDNPLSVALPEAGVVVAPHAGAAGPALALGTPATPSTTLTWNTFTQVATFGSPQAVSTDLTSAALIPPTTSVTTYYDKTNGGNAPTTPPVIWHTAPETHAKIVEYAGPAGDNIGDPINPPCWRVWLPNGLMEEFGCTLDSLQYYPSSTSDALQGRKIMTTWLLDGIIDPRGNQIHFTYTRDLQTFNAQSYPRDSAPTTITYAAPNCHNTTTLCTGSNWNPQRQVAFQSAATPTRRTNTPANCNTGGSLRCDDPLDLSGSGGAAAPLIQHTFVLNEIDVQVLVSGTWQNLRRYQFAYEQQGPTQKTDPATGMAESTAGYLDLTQIQEAGADSSTSLAPLTYSYTSQAEFYEDTLYKPNGGSCGPSWNTGNSNTNNQTSSSPCNVADDQAWSRIVLTDRHDYLQRSSKAGTNGARVDTWVTSIYHYTYQLTYPLSAQECSDCVAGMYWGNQLDTDYLDYYNGLFMGFTVGSVSLPDGSIQTSKFYATSGWGVWDTGNVSCTAILPPVGSCHSAPYWNLGTAAHGRPYEVDQFAQDGTTLMGKTVPQYNVLCPASGVSGSSGTQWSGNLVAAQDPQNPVASCDIQTKQTDTYTYEVPNGQFSNYTQATTANTYDSYGRVTQTVRSSNDGGLLGSPTTIVQNTGYVWNDNISAQQYSATGTYLIDRVAWTNIADRASSPTVHATCGDILYDGQGYQTGQQSTLTQGLATGADQFTSCGTSANGFASSGQMRTTAAYDSFGNPIAGTDAEGNNGNAAHKGCTLSSVSYTTCASYDSSGTLLSASSQTTGAGVSLTGTLNYSTPASTNGWGLWPSSQTDPNSKSQSATYDPLGRLLTQTLPEETPGTTTKTASYTNTCAGAIGPPCLEIDTTQRLDTSTTITRRQFYDGFGHLIETRTPAPGSQDVVTYQVYDVAGRVVAASNPYFVASGTGFSVPDSNQLTTNTTYDALGRTRTVQDPLGNTTTTGYTVNCGWAGDSNCYEAVAIQDANGHQPSVMLIDAFGRTIYAQRFTGSNGNYTVSQTFAAVYDLLGNQVQFRHPDGTSYTTATYDAASRVTAASDPDLGSYTYTYDQNGNVTSSTDPRGAGGTVYHCYDGGNRLIKVGTAANCASPLAIYNFDEATAYGGVTIANGKGRLTSSQFTSNGVTGDSIYDHDGRGRVNNWRMDLGGTDYLFTTTYNDADQPTSVHYPAGDLFSTSYTAQGWLGGVTYTPNGGSAQTVLSGLSYTGLAGAMGSPTSGLLGPGSGVYAFTLGVDNNGRATSASVTNLGGTVTKFSQTRSFDALGNVITTNTTLPDGTDNQTFCYDDLNRLTWAGSTGTPNCGRSLTAGTLTSAQYQQTYGYDTLDRLTQGPIGSGYTYSSGHLHAASSAGSGVNTYTAAYDAAGEQTCRATSNAQTCAGTPTGQTMTYDALNRLLTWQNAASSPTSTASYAYDGSGERVQQVVTNSGTTTTTRYIGAYEELATTGGTTTTTTYYGAGPFILEVQNGTISYLVKDLLGHVTVSLDTSGNVTAQQLYSPYGTFRYSHNSLPTSYSFTGQRADASGLLYFHARYYDPVLGQFTSADTVQGPNRYGYVGGNPETATDPSGHCGISKRCFDGGSFLPCGNTRNPYGGSCSDATPGNNPYWNQAVIAAQCLGMCAVAAIAAVAAFIIAPELIVGAIPVAGPVLAAGLGATEIGTGTGAFIAANILLTASTLASPGVTADQQKNSVIDLATTLILTGIFHIAGKALANDAPALSSACGNSFDPATPVATPDGAKAIGDIQVGETVMAYDPTTGQTKAEPVEHVFINHDTNLLDVTLAPFTTTTTPATQDDAISPKEAHAALASHGTRAPPTSTETLHTTTEHPFLTTVRGFVDAAKLQVGEQVRQLDGHVGVVVAVTVTPGAAVRYNLTVRELHTFAVGAGLWVVHNCDGETFYRTMSEKHYQRLVNTGKLPATGETFISPTRDFAENYDGALVKFSMKSGFSSAIESVGVRDTSPIVTSRYPNMPIGSAGWNTTSAYFKGERGQINIGLGKGPGLDIFNNYLDRFERVR